MQRRFHLWTWRPSLMFPKAYKTSLSIRRISPISLSSSTTQLPPTQQMRTHTSTTIWIPQMYQRGYRNPAARFCTEFVRISAGSRSPRTTEAVKRRSRRTTEVVGWRQPNHAVGKTSQTNLTTPQSQPHDRSDYTRSWHEISTERWTFSKDRTYPRRGRASHEGKH